MAQDRFGMIFGERVFGVTEDIVQIVPGAQLDPTSTQAVRRDETVDLCRKPRARARSRRAEVEHSLSRIPQRIFRQRKASNTTRRCARAIVRLEQEVVARHAL